MSLQKLIHFLICAPLSFLLYLWFSNPSLHLQTHLILHISKHLSLCPRTTPLGRKRWTQAQTHAFQSSAVDGDKWLSSRSGHLIHSKSVSCSHYLHCINSYLNTLSVFCHLSNYSFNFSYTLRIIFVLTLSLIILCIYSFYPFFRSSSNILH